MLLQRCWETVQKHSSLTHCEPQLPIALRVDRPCFARTLYGMTIGHQGMSDPTILRPMAGKQDKRRDARLEIRMTPEERALLEQAAALGGEDLSTFVRRAALVEARVLTAKLGLTTRT